MIRPVPCSALRSCRRRGREVDEVVAERGIPLELARVAQVGLTAKREAGVLRGRRSPPPEAVPAAEGVEYVTDARSGGAPGRHPEQARNDLPGRAPGDGGGDPLHLKQQAAAPRGPPDAAPGPRSVIQAAWLATTAPGLELRAQCVDRPPGPRRAGLHAGPRRGWPGLKSSPAGVCATRNDAALSSSARRPPRRWKARRAGGTRDVVEHEKAAVPAWACSDMPRSVARGRTRACPRSRSNSGRAVLVAASWSNETVEAVSHRVLHREHAGSGRPTPGLMRTRSQQGER